MVTRRVHNREFRLRPDKRVNRIVRYVVATLVKHYELELHALTVMSTHYHCRFHDPHARVSDFARDAHATIAKLVIRTFGDEDESLWAPTPANFVEDECQDGAIDQIAYCATNPCAAGLVRRAKEWPGVADHWPNPPTVIKQPEKFFQEDTWSPGATTAAGNPKIHWAESARLVFTKPRGYDGVPESELIIQIRTAIKRREAKALEQWSGVKGAYPGKKALTRVSRRHRATASESKRGAKRIPSIRAADALRRAERLSGLRMWRRDYRESMKAWPTNREVVFPLGTNKMRCVHHVNVDGNQRVGAPETPT